MIVPTIDTVRYGYLLDKLLAGRKSVLFTGQTGVGKVCSSCWLCEWADEYLLRRLEGSEIVCSMLNSLETSKKFIDMHKNV